MKTEKHTLIPVLIFLGALALFTAGLAGGEPLQIDTRFGLFVREMWQNGVGPYPQLYGLYYPDYPAGPTLLSYLAALATGAIDRFSLALPTAAAAAVLLTVTWLIGAGEQSRFPRRGFAAVLLALCSIEFLHIARISSLDLYPAAAAAVSFLLVLRSAGDGRWGRCGFLALCFLAGYLARGPLGVVIPATAALAACAALGKFRPVPAIGAMAAAVLGVLWYLWIGLAERLGGEELVQLVESMQAGSRFESDRWPLYYFFDAAGSYAIAYPLGLLAALLYLWKSRRNLFRTPESGGERLVRALAFWMLAVLCGMSIPGTKHLRYVVSAIPPAALLAAMLLENPGAFRVPERLRDGFFRLAELLPLLLLAAFPIAVIIFALPPVSRALGGEVRLLPQLCWVLPGAALAVYANRSFRAPGRAAADRRLVNLAGAAFTFFVIQAALLEPVETATNSSIRFVAAAEALRPDGTEVYFYGLGPDGDENKYMFHVAPERYFFPRYLTDRKPKKRNPYTSRRSKLVSEAAAFPAGALIAARLDRWNRLQPELREQYETIASGRVGRRDAVLLRKR